MTSKRDIEIVNAIIRATYEYFDIPVDVFIKNKSHKYAYMRRLCWYVIKNNTMLNYREISELFDMNYSNIYRGIEEVAIQKNTYRDVARNLKNIIAATNNVEKNFEWQVE